MSNQDGNKVEVLNDGGNTSVSAAKNGNNKNKEPDLKEKTEISNEWNTN